MFLYVDQLLSVCRNMSNLKEKKTEDGLTHLAAVQKSEP